MIELLFVMTILLLMPNPTRASARRSSTDSRPGIRPMHKLRTIGA
ncbi:MAG: hypothetical protein ABI794_01840 [Betaproteobacteria bacterium]